MTAQLSFQILGCDSTKILVRIRNITMRLIVSFTALARLFI